jgi:hypothetical protein
LIGPAASCNARTGLEFGGGPPASCDQVMDGYFFVTSMIASSIDPPPIISPTMPVPAPIVGAGLPGMLAFFALVAWWSAGTDRKCGGVQLPLADRDPVSLRGNWRAAAHHLIRLHDLRLSHPA